MSGFTVKYYKIKFQLHRCTFQDNGNTIIYEFKVHKGVYTYDLGFDGVTIRPFSGDYDLLIYKQRGPWRGAQKKQIMSSSIEDLMLEVIKQIMDRLEPLEP